MLYVSRVAFNAQHTTVSVAITGFRSLLIPNVKAKIHSLLNTVVKPREPCILHFIEIRIMSTTQYTLHRIQLLGYGVVVASSLSQGTAGKTLNSCDLSAIFRTDMPWIQHSKLQTIMHFYN